MLGLLSFACSAFLSYAFTAVVVDHAVIDNIPFTVSVSRTSASSTTVSISPNLPSNIQQTSGPLSLLPGQTTGLQVFTASPQTAAGGYHPAVALMIAYPASLLESSFILNFNLTSKGEVV